MMQLNILDISVATVIVVLIIYYAEKRGFIKPKKKESQINLQTITNESETPIVFAEGTARWIVTNVEPIDKELSSLRLFLENEEGVMKAKDVLASALQVDLKNPNFWAMRYVVIKESGDEQENYYKEIIAQKEKEIDVLKQRIAVLVEKLNELAKAPDAREIDEMEKRGATMRSRTPFGAGRLPGEGLYDEGGL